MNLIVDTKGLKELENAIDEKAIRRATTRTVNELGRGLSTKLVKDARSEYSIKSSELKSYIKTTKADSHKPVFSMTISSSPLSLSKFQMREKTFRTKRGKRKGVTVKVFRKQSRKVVKGGFTGTNRQIFKRTGQERLPIKKLTTLSAPQMFKEESIKDGYGEVEEKMPKIFERNLDFYLSKKK